MKNTIKKILGWLFAIVLISGGVLLFLNFVLYTCSDENGYFYERTGGRIQAVQVFPGKQRARLEKKAKIEAKFEKAYDEAYVEAYDKAYSEYQEVYVGRFSAKYAVVYAKAQAEEYAKVHAYFVAYGKKSDKAQYVAAIQEIAQKPVVLSYTADDGTIEGGRPMMAIPPRGEEIDTRN